MEPNVRGRVCIMAAGDSSVYLGLLNGAAPLDLMVSYRDSHSVSVACVVPLNVGPSVALASTLAPAFEQRV
jgi:hypothetical protein